jgi:uncharacterized membrane protein
MTTGTISDDVRAYLQAVRERLADLPAEEREHLLSDVEAALLDGAGESELGPPERFADELRAAAGIPAPEPTPAAEPAVPSWASRLERRLETLIVPPGVARLATELAPIWWVLRGYLTIVAIAGITGADWSSNYSFLPVLDSGELTVLLLAVAIAISVAVGLRHRRVTPAVVVVNVLLAIFLPYAIGQTLGRPVESDVTSYAESAPPAPGLSYDGDEVTNVYPYDREGRLLQDVRLFDQQGRPLAIGSPTATDPDRRVPRTATGHQVFNAFPVRYFESGTRRIADPDAGAPKRPRRIVTKPVR